MKNFRLNILFLLGIILFTSVNAICQEKANSATESDSKTKKKKKKKQKKYRLPKIDLSHWKVTLPATNQEGKPVEIDPPDILNFASNEVAAPFMYIDSAQGAIVFHAMPTQSKTRNTKYTRSELREQINPGNNNVNWTFKQGGEMTGRLAMQSVSKDDDGNYHRVIIMQIHGRLTNEQRDLIGEDDNNAPPILKIYWDKGKVRVKTKVLKNLKASGTEILHEDAWGDDEGYSFEEEVGFGVFSLAIKVTEGKMTVSLNRNEFKVYDDIHIEKWGVFENYFKAGNYFQSTDEGSFAKVKFYQLEVSH